MNTIEQQLSKASKEIRLTRSEYSSMRGQLERHIGFPAQPIVSRYYIFSILRSRALRYIAMLVVITLATSSGVSYAAESALPGDFLYPIKTKVTEKVRAAITTNPKARGRLETEFAVRRLDEATKLAETGRLTPAVKDEITTNFEQHAARVHATIAALAHGTGSEKDAEKNESDAAEMSSHFESSLLAHGAILASLASIETSSEHGMSSPDAHATSSNASRTSASFLTRHPAGELATSSLPLSSLITSIKNAAQQTIASRAEIEAMLKFSSTTAAMTRADERQKSARSELEAAKHLFSLHERSFLDDNAGTIKSRLANADDLMAQGQAEMSAGEYGTAFALFQSAARIAEETDIFLDAAMHEQIHVEDSSSTLVRSKDDVRNHSATSQMQSDDVPTLPPHNQLDQPDRPDNERTASSTDNSLDITFPF